MADPANLDTLQRRARAGMWHTAAEATFETAPNSDPSVLHFPMDTDVTVDSPARAQA